MSNSEEEKEFYFQFHRGWSSNPPTPAFLSDVDNGRFNRENRIESKESLSKVFTNPPSSGNAIKTIVKINSTTYYAVANGTFWVTTDSGTSWTNKGTVNNTSRKYYSWCTFGDHTLLVDGTKYIRDYDGSTLTTVEIPDNKTADMIARHQNRIYVADRNNSYVYYTTSNDHTDFITDGGTFTGTNNTKTGIQGLISWRNRLLILGQDIIELIGDPSTSPILQNVLDIACQTPRSLVKTPEAIYFASNQGIIEWNGSDRYNPLSTEIKFYIQRNIALPDLWGAWDKQNDRLFFSDSNKLLIYDRVSPSWWKDEFTHEGLWPVVEQDAPVFFTGCSSSDVAYYYDVNNKDESATLTVETKALDLGFPRHWKRIISVSVSGVFEGGAASVYLKHTGKETTFSNYGNMWTETITTNLTKSTALKNIKDRRGRRFSIKITAPAPALIDSISIGFDLGEKE